ncbi:MAG: sigma-70 family RNA polymerase sigma factor [Streptosporangiaceae bacterium]|jgi:RNA polymerase sigma-70 factor (ECF subfamily)
MISPEELDKEIEALVTGHGKDLERYLQGNKIRLPSHLVGDVINDALLAVADKRRRGHTIDNPRSYLFKVARNAAIDRLKSRYTTGIPDPRAAAEYQSKYDMLAHAEISHDLRIAIRQLPPRQRQIIELRYLRDFTVKETAEILNIAEGTVGPATTTALRRMRQILSGQIGSPKEETA